MRGLSPRARGNRARASAWMSVARAYPRERGGTSSVRVDSVQLFGAYPRERGGTVERRRAVHDVTRGPIPASAGEPRRSSLPTRGRAYPRERGGTRAPCRHRVASDAGLSPRARGNRIGVSRACSCQGPIPASAGEPARAMRVQACGSGPIPASAGEPIGRRRIRARNCRRHRGPIPASAGEPRRAEYADALSRAYPRERGGTARQRRSLAITGPIPASAGEPSRSRSAVTASSGPIPASAGEPYRLIATLCGAGPIPASAGEPLTARDLPTRSTGPIPASAGEPDCDLRRSCGSDGPIPASAGEPVDPTSRAQPAGLSPRARGNRIARLRDSAVIGPIPASAGEPWIDGDA